MWNRNHEWEMQRFTRFWIRFADMYFAAVVLALLHADEARQRHSLHVILSIFITYDLHIKVMLRIPGLKLCVLWTDNISSHERGKEFEEEFLKVGKRRERMGLQGRE